MVSLTDPYGRILGSLDRKEITNIINKYASSQERKICEQLPQQWHSFLLSVTIYNYDTLRLIFDRLCGLVVRVLGNRSGGPGSIPGTTRKNVMGPLSLVSTTE
jgi:hypothetical protein